MVTLFVPMMRWFGLILLLCVGALPGSSARRVEVRPIVDHAIEVTAVPIENPLITLAPDLHFVKGWSLESDDSDFGGLSSLVAVNSESFIAVSDYGALIHFKVDANGALSNVRAVPLPRGCADDSNKFNRDSESITRDHATGAVWIGFEWRNAICASDKSLQNARALARPLEMRAWSKTGGPETIVRLADGRFLVFAEAAVGNAKLPELVVFDGDPTIKATRARTLHYRPPEHHFSPTDAAELPDGRLLIIYRRFEPPYAFSAVLSIVPPIGASPPDIIEGRTITRFSRPGLTSNFEGVTATQEGTRTFVWIVSDNNFMWIEHTYLLKFELINPPPQNGQRDQSFKQQ